MIARITIPQRRGILVTLLVVGLTFSVGFGAALAVSMSAKPNQGPRDDGTGTQTQITLSGDLRDIGTDLWQQPPRAYWDTPNPTAPAAAYQIPVPRGAVVNDDGTFSFNVTVPLTDASGLPVRPGAHVITVCATHGTVSVVITCTSTGFQVLPGLATLSTSSGLRGSPLTIHGSQWVPGPAREAIRITWAPAGANIEEILNFPGSSTWRYTFSVPNLAAGTYQIRICNVPNSGRTLCASGDTLFKPFTILEPVTPTPTRSPTPKPTASPTPTPSPTPKPTASPTPTPSPTPKPTASPTPSATATPTPTPTPTPAATPVPTATPIASSTSVASLSPTPTASPTATLTPSLTPSPTPSLTLAPTATPTPAPTHTPSAEPTPVPTAAPTPTPSPTATPAPIAAWPEHLHSPGDPSAALDAGAIAGISLLALLIAFLVPFPGTLFNKTVEENYAEIQGWIAGLKRRWNSMLDAFGKGPLGPARRGIGRVLTGRFGVWAFVGLSALVYGFLSPAFGLDTTSLALFLGLMVGLVLITAAFDLPLRLYHGITSQAHDRGVLRALWWTLLVAVICVVISRLANFQPGYLYGLIVSIAFASEISKRDQGLGTWLAAIWLLALSFAAWIALALVRQGTFDPWLALFLQTVLVTFVVAGVETLVVGLLPLRFLPGHPLYQWRRGAWFVVFALSVMGYLLILIDPANGYLSDNSRTPTIIGIIFLVGFGLVSFGTWAYFRYRPAKLGGDRPGEARAA